MTRVAAVLAQRHRQRVVLLSTYPSGRRNVVASTGDDVTARAPVPTGPRSLSQRAQADIIAAVTGRELDVEELTRQQARDHLAQTWPTALADSILDLRAYATYATAVSTTVSTTVEDITGHPAPPYERWVHDRRLCLREDLPFSTPNTGREGAAARPVKALRFPAARLRLLNRYLPNGPLHSPVKTLEGFPNPTHSERTNNLMSNQGDDMNQPHPDPDYDVAVVGAGFAGLSAALLLGRSRRSVIVFDAGPQRNAPSAGVHNYLGREGVSPEELFSGGRDEVRRYGVHITNQPVLSVERDSAAPDAGGFEVHHEAGVVRVRRVVIASGLVDELPEIPGLAQLWGRDVLHCPFCHGWEIHGVPVGVLSTTPFAVHQAEMFSGLTDDLMFFEHDGPPVCDTDREALAALGVPIVTGEVTGVESTDRRMAGLRLAGGEFIARRALVVFPPAHAATPLLTSLGLQPVPLTFGDLEVGSHLPANADGSTSVPGLYVAGNTTDLLAQAMGAAAHGNLVGASVQTELVTQDVQTALAATHH